MREGRPGARCAYCGHLGEDGRQTGGRQRARDRDPEGKARNARPRDGLGRPLPYGSEGVAATARGRAADPGEALAEAQRLLTESMPFHAHEVLEDAWKASPQRERALWKGLAQLAVGITHLARGNRPGGARLLLRGAEGIEPYAQERPYGIDVPGLSAWARALADDPAAQARYGPGAVPAPPLRADSGR